jgi:hypothetical protein
VWIAERRARTRARRTRLRKVKNPLPAAAAIHLPWRTPLPGPLARELVLIHEGYHPVVKAPGTNAYYLNFLAGNVRKISAVNDPHYDWVSQNWSGNPIQIPIKGLIFRRRFRGSTGA